MCKKQTSVSHSSTESETISLDVGLRMHGLPALDQWDIAIEVLRTTKHNIQPGHTSSGKPEYVQPNHTSSGKLESERRPFSVGCKNRCWSFWILEWYPVQLSSDISCSTCALRLQSLPQIVFHLVSFKDGAVRRQTSEGEKNVALSFL